MNIKNSVLDYIRYKQLNWYGHTCNGCTKKVSLENFCNGAQQEDEEREEVTTGMIEGELATWNG